MVMIKKKLLFTINSLHCGGAENSLISLLQILDYNVYDVDLLLFKKEGFFLKQVPDQVTILHPLEAFEYFDLSFYKMLKKAILNFRFDVIVARIKYFQLKKEPNKAVLEQKFWKYLSKCLPNQKVTYDVAIGFLEKTPNYYVVDKVKAKLKIGFIRTDYKMMGMSPSIDNIYFKKLNYIATNSDNATNSLKDIFPNYLNKIVTIENFFAPQALFGLANEKIEVPKNDLLIVSIGRLVALKNFELAISTCAVVKKYIPKVLWIVIGEGEERENLQALIIKNQLEDNFILIGELENPYPYLKNCNFYVHTSKFEGKSRAIEEAKIFKKTIVTTNFPSVTNQIKEGENGFIVDFNHEKMADLLLKIVNESIALEVQSSAIKTDDSTLDNLNYFYKIINS